MKKLCCFLIVLCVLLWATTAFAQNTQAEKILEEQLSSIDLSDVQQALHSLSQTYDIDLLSLDFSQCVKDIIQGKADFSSAFATAFEQVFANTLKQTTRLFSVLCGIGLLCTLCDEILQGIGDDGVRRAVRFACAALCAVVLTNRLLQAVSAASQMMQDLCFWLENLLPVMLVILATLGAGAGINALSPSVAIINAILQQGVVRIILPMIVVMGALSMVDALDERRRFCELIEFLSRVIRWALGLILTIFIGALTLKSINAVSYDALAVRTMKFTFGSLPMVGGAVSDSLDTIISSLLMLKNGIGTAGVIVSVTICMSPVLAIALQVLCLECACALTRMLGNRSAGQIMQAVCDVYKTLLYVLIAALLLFFVTIMLFISAGNAAFTG